MTLRDAILKAKHEEGKYSSPPPEVNDFDDKVKKKKQEYPYAYVHAKVDSSPPRYDISEKLHKLHQWSHAFNNIYKENMIMLMRIKHAYYRGGLVDCRWVKKPVRSIRYYQQRVDFLKRVRRDNLAIYKRIVNTNARIDTTAELNRDWICNKQKIVERASAEFVLFPPIPHEDMEDLAFRAAPDVKRPRVYLKLGVRDGAVMGELCVELFTDTCPRTCRLFLDLLDGDTVGHGYVNTCFFRASRKERLMMLVSDSGVAGTNEIFIKVVSPEGQTFTAYFSGETLIEEVKHRAIDYFYPTGETGASRYKIVRVLDTTTLHDFLTLTQEQVMMQEELLLVERRLPEAGTLWDLGSVRAPQHGTIAAATASLPTPSNAMRQPNLQSLLSTNELSYELRKILISLIEAGARLAASGRNYEMTLAQLTSALNVERQHSQPAVIQVITPEDIAARLNINSEYIALDDPPGTDKVDGNDMYRRAEHLQRFLEKFREWRTKIAEPPSPESIGALRDLGFSYEEADKALRHTGCNVPAAASYLIGERGSSIFELVNGLPDGLILQTLLKQPHIQRGLLNTRMLIAFIAMVGQTGSATLWLNSPHGSPLLSQISRTYHSEKYCLAVNQFSQERRENTANGPSTSRQRKVPHLYWSGGDVIYNNGFGCYAQRGREVPIGAENYHYPHSMPGLLSMRVTVDDEMCGIFNITFKALPQLDLRNVVFGRVIRPCSTYNIISGLGNALSSRPVVEVRSTRRKVKGHWVTGAPNTELAKRSSACLRKSLVTRGRWKRVLSMKE